MNEIAALRCTALAKMVVIVPKAIRENSCQITSEIAALRYTTLAMTVREDGKGCANRTRAVSAREARPRQSILNLVMCEIATLRCTTLAKTVTGTGCSCAKGTKLCVLSVS
ncbi:hypothetical protein Q766_05185 [Flavobacterium subsaxonicum WB 4.1-42 = DSM 21790]|uniref:Uncharacterized protein n=1 Tax=Flavobacterium subsaxonicum WB 4.1-42 = DSM 21790 TaxID=1121898 RepID=A0A0A2MPR3_9FLAO|nr:hypothetical protein Q766_05185 [Flavobacterium subsaxonicum WB 4.1-42 = DSM 21790]